MMVCKVTRKPPIKVIKNGFSEMRVVCGKWQELVIEKAGWRIL